MDDGKETHPPEEDHEAKQYRQQIKGFTNPPPKWVRYRGDTTRETRHGDKRKNAQQGKFPNQRQGASAKGFRYAILGEDFPSEPLDEEDDALNTEGNMSIEESLLRNQGQNMIENISKDSDQDIELIDKDGLLSKEGNEETIHYGSKSPLGLEDFNSKDNDPSKQANGMRNPLSPQNSNLIRPNSRTYQTREARP